MYCTNHFSEVDASYLCRHGGEVYQNFHGWFLYLWSFFWQLPNQSKAYAKANLVLNWEKCHFMVQEGIMLGHKISARGIEVEIAEIYVIEKLPQVNVRTLGVSSDMQDSIGDS